MDLKYERRVLMSSACALLLACGGTARAEFDFSMFAAPAVQEAQDLNQKVEQERLGRSLFHLGKHDGKTILGIRAGQFDRDFLCTTTIERLSGAPPGSLLDPFPCVFRRSGNLVRLAARQDWRRAPAGTPEAKSIERTFQDEFLASVPVLAEDPSNALVFIDLGALLAQDVAKAGPRMAAQSAGSSVEVDRAASVLVRAKAHERNLETRMELTFNARSGRPRRSQVFAVVDLDIAALPDPAGFEPRPADPRVGHFSVDYEDAAAPALKGRLSPAVSLVTRWRLEKKEPDAPVSDVKAPVVWWLSDDIPEAYREPIRKGLLAWNAAFEAVGLRGALVVKEVDKDMTPEERASFDPASISYNVVRWMMRGSFAQGPSRADPRTGEIFHAGIRIGDLIGRSAAEEAGQEGREERDYLRESGRRAAQASAALEAAGVQPPEERRRFISEFLTHLVMHEAGHILGVRHNFKGSASLSAEDEAAGLRSTTVMDYLGADLEVRPDGPGGRYWQTVLGPYDYWAIEYAYKPLAGSAEERQAELARIAAKGSSEPRLAYASDGEAWEGSDPAAQAWDAGRDAAAYAGAEIDKARRTLAALDAGAQARSGQALSAFDAALSGQYSALSHALKVVGGLRQRRGTEATGGPAYGALSAAEQRAAVSLLTARLLAEDPLPLSATARGRLQADLLQDERNRPVDVAAQAGALQAAAVRGLLSPGRLAAVEAANQYRSPGETPFEPAEVIDAVSEAVWLELGRPGPVALPGGPRRAMQEAHVSALNKLIGPDAPVAARPAARRALLRLEARLKATRARSAEDSTARAWLDETLAALKKGLGGAAKDSSGEDDDDA